MLAAVFRGKGKIALEQISIRKPGPNEILIKVAACGVCGTDLHIYNGDKGAADTPKGTVLGHEFAGTICEVGSNVKSLKEGDNVSIDPNDYCGGCYYCRMGKSHFCENMIGIGTTIHGGFAEYCTIAEKQAYKLPKTMPLELGAMTEPVSCCLHGIDLSKIKASDTVIIIGAGTIGLMMMQLAKVRGASRVIVIEPIEEKRNQALQLGASMCIDPTKCDALEYMQSKGIPPANVCIECVGLGKTVEEAIRLCGKGGIVMIFGLTPPDCEIPLKPFEVFRKELTITSSFISPYAFQRALDLIETGTIKIEPLLDTRVPLKDISKVFEDASYRKKGKILIVP